jgi:hypothetical protein
MLAARLGPSTCPEKGVNDEDNLRQGHAEQKGESVRR